MFPCCVQPHRQNHHVFKTCAKQEHYVYITITDTVLCTLRIKLHTARSILNNKPRHDDAGPQRKAQGS